MAINLINMGVSLTNSLTCNILNKNVIIRIEAKQNITLGITVEKS